MTAMHITRSRAETPQTAETSGPTTRCDEPPVISELALTTLYLERLAETTGPLDDATAVHVNGSTPE